MSKASAKAYDIKEASIRTEDIKLENLKDVFVETSNDKELLDALINKQPLLLVGSRGTGKTMLLRMAEQKLLEKSEVEKRIPVFVNLATCTIQGDENLLKVIITRVLISLRKSLKKQGKLINGTIFKPVVTSKNESVIQNKLEAYISGAEEKYETDMEVNDESINVNVARLIDFLEEVCEEFEIEQLVLIFDEACQVFNPKQQRIFFDFFRALRSYNIVCKAAVYPGIENYGTFQKLHDATIKKVERSVKADCYLEDMKEIVRKHFTGEYEKMRVQAEMLDVVIYLSSGNPRFLLKSINEIISGKNKFELSKINKVIKEFYGSQIWSEHIKLGEIYTGHTQMLNWSRNFIEDKVLKDIKKINMQDDKKTIYFAISRNTPEIIRNSIKTLEYSGIISLHTEGTKFRNEMYDRYELNLGIVILSEEQVNVTKRTKEIVESLAVKLFKDYGSTSQAFEGFEDLIKNTKHTLDINDVVSSIKEKSIDELEMSNFIKELLKNNQYNTIEDILYEDEGKLQMIKYIGPKRSRAISNIVYNAVLEYISG